MNNRKKVLIIGGGTAGTVILQDLSEYFDVVVFEQSKYKSIPFYYRIPLSIGLLFSGSNNYVRKFNFYAFNGRPIPFFQSNCLGGASVINGSVHVLGSLDVWRKIFKKFSLNFNNFHKLYESVFSKKNKNSKIRLKAQSPDELDEAFYKSMKIYSVNRGDNIFFSRPSCGPIWNTVKRFFRSSVLDLMSNRIKAINLSSPVDDIEIQDGSAKGIWVGNQLINADVIILSAGVVGTGRLLCRIFDKLTPLVAHRKLNGVKDHTNIRINVRSKKRIFSLNQINLPFPKKCQFFLKNRKNLFSIIRGSGASSATNVDLYGKGEVSLRINLLRFYESGRLGSTGKLFDNSDCGFSLSLTQVNPRSQGFIDQDGDVNPGYLTSPEDMQFLRDALNYVLKLLQTPPLSEYVEEIIDHEEILHSPEEYIRKNFYSGYHLIGGTSDLIDADFKVRGVEGLYVCDASIFSEYPSSNIHSSVVLLAKAFSKKLINKQFG